ncbi:MAG TPA: hypothetical protein VLK27_13270 [Chthoniobacterales bacterium]|nr:hypothetical protein [Chthoniobacterales bacterium]
MLATTAVAQWQVVNVNKVTLEGTLKGGGNFVVRVDSDSPRTTSGEYFGATDAPRAVVSGVTVKTDNARIAFPKQAFVDLANPLLQTTSITGQGSGNLKVRFTGGEGATNYEVEYFIEGNRLVRRTVSYFERGGAQKDRVVKTTNFSEKGLPEAAQPSPPQSQDQDEEAHP